MFDEAEFTRRVQEDTDWWNSGQGTTCEFSMGYDENLPKKMEILAEFNGKLNGGLWVVFQCRACIKHSDGKEPLHAMIFKNV